MKLCTNSIDCSIRSLWSMVQASIDKLLDKITLADLSNSEKEASFTFQGFLEENSN
jgi:DNA-binding IscR family transcriptional regulator